MQNFPFSTKFYNFFAFIYIFWSKLCYFRSVRINILFFYFYIDNLCKYLYNKSIKMRGDLPCE